MSNSIEDLTLTIELEQRIKASLETTFAALLEQLGPLQETPEGRNLSMTLEPWPGGRWFRDLGAQDGHFWGTVQAIKRPTLLELSGPLFASYPLVSNLQYRLSAVDGGTLIVFRHTAMGFMPADHKKNIASGWKHTLQRVGLQAEGRLTGSPANGR